MVIQTIHLTDTRTYRSCKRKYRYAHLDRITKMTEDVSPLAFGKAGHQMLDQLYGGEEPNYNLAPDDESQQLLSFLMDTYRTDMYANDVQKWQVASKEQSLAIEIDGVTVLFTLDLLVTENGEYWAVDHKFLSRFPDKRTLEVDDQITGYLWALNKLGIPTRGLIYNVLLKKSLGTPNILARGGVSRAMSTLENTTKEMYLQTIKITGGTPEAYKEELDWFDKREHPLFRRYRETRSRAEQANFETYLRATLDEMKRTEVWYPNPTYDCYRCEFQELCKAEMEGEGWRSYIGATHRRKEDGER